MNKIDTSKLDPSRTAYVLLHIDESHIYARPDGEPAWSYDENQMKTVQKVAEETGPCPYRPCELQRALVLVGNKQSEIEKSWLPTIEAMRKEKKLNERLNIYRKKLRRSNLPHPLLYDAELRKLLQL